MVTELAPELLSRTLSEVLEDAAFIFTESADDSLQWQNSLVQSSISYEGQVSGVLSLAVENEMARMFAANLLGIEPDDPDAEIRSAEAVSEMLNIVCGVFLERWLGSNNQCRLGIPTTTSLSAAQELQHLQSAKCNAILEDEDGNRIDIFVR